jgi:hypothetical protein
MSKDITWDRFVLNPVSRNFVSVSISSTRLSGDRAHVSNEGEK